MNLSDNRLLLLEEGQEQRERANTRLSCPIESKATERLNRRFRDPLNGNKGRSEPRKSGKGCDRVCLSCLQDECDRIFDKWCAVWRQPPNFRRLFQDQSQPNEVLTLRRADVTK